jgi:hypothetical protein
MKRLIALLLCCVASSAAADTTRLSGIVRNTSGKPIASLDIHFYRRNGDGFSHLTATTAADGRWTIDLPPGEWRGAAKTDDVISRGYFCEPGFIWCGEAGELCDGVIGDWPPLWGGGEIIWTQSTIPNSLTSFSFPPARPSTWRNHARPTPVWR